jgi:hypothetical protein
MAVGTALLTYQQAVGEALMKNPNLSEQEKEAIGNAAGENYLKNVAPKRRYSAVRRLTFRPAYLFVDNIAEWKIARVQISHISTDRRDIATGDACRRRKGDVSTKV